MVRPKFAEIKDFEEFSRYYWYRDELIQICRQLGLKADGGKIELNNVIRAYFAEQRIVPMPKQSAIKRRPSVCTELTLDTGLIECGFTFSNRFRDFFARQTQTEHFKFNVDMVATVKAVKAQGDKSFSLGDLLEIFYGTKTYAQYDKSALQWNRFVKDFCADPATQIYSERLKAAAALWKIVRESDKEKVYSREVLERYKDRIIKP